MKARSAPFASRSTDVLRTLIQERAGAALAAILLGLQVLPSIGANFAISNVTIGPGDTLYANESNQPISGALVTVGYFPENYDVGAHLHDVGSVLANFTILASALTGKAESFGDGDFPGYVEKRVDGPIITATNPLKGRRLYSLVGNASPLAASTNFILIQLNTIKDDVPVEHEYTTDPGQAGAVILMGGQDEVTGDFGGGHGVYPTIKFDYLTPERWIRLATPNPPGGTISGLGTYPIHQSATLTATANPGYVFKGWTGDVTGPDNPITIVVDANKTIGEVFGPDLADPDADGLNNYKEIVVHQSDPMVSDSDGDGFNDGMEAETGFSPTDAESTPDTLSSIRTAVEFRFYAAAGVSYRLEESPDFINWTTIEPEIIGEGGMITRFYSTENRPTRSFRARRN